MQKPLEFLFKRESTPVMVEKSVLDTLVDHVHSVPLDSIKTTLIKEIETCEKMEEIIGVTDKFTQFQTFIESYLDYRENETPYPEEYL